MPVCADRPPHVVLCGSMSFFGHMLQLRSHLSHEHVEVALPDAESDADLHDPRQYSLFRRSVVHRHLKRVRNIRTFGILVTNFDKHGVPDYIGPSTFAEIATAATLNKKIYVLQDFPEVFRDVLSDWGAVPLRGQLQPLIEHYRSACPPETQLELFAA
jgi:hypothetical protein